ncbi:GerMN domain-containing protein [Arthrobacter sp. H5]|uniref:GerMN domain-containing protein n=1 Tax=Arthrobacter sp. H5 TaxID=1267973 RepID=UPI0004AD1119|nr:GerMN domain-containing protein [Arthrobacter sp. H5]
MKVITARLLADKEQCFGQSALCNALYRSNLAFESGRVEGETVAVNLSSELILGGPCDAPRVKAQLEQTAMTATGVRSASVSFDGVPLDELLSGM